MAELILEWFPAACEVLMLKRFYEQILDLERLVFAVELPFRDRVKIIWIRSPARPPVRRNSAEVHRQDELIPTRETASERDARPEVESQILLSVSSTKLTKRSVVNRCMMILA